MSRSSASSDGSIATRLTSWRQVIVDLDESGAGLALDFDLRELLLRRFMLSCICWACFMRPAS